MWQLALMAAFLLPAVTVVPSGGVGLVARFVLVAAVSFVALRAGIVWKALISGSTLAVGASFYGFALFSIAWSAFSPVTFFKAALGLATLVAAGAIGWAVGRTGPSRAALYPFAWAGLAWVLLSGVGLAMGRAWHPSIGLFQGPCDNPNMFASVTAVLSLPTALTLNRARGRLWRVLANLGWIGAGMAVIASGSRGGLIIWISAVTFSTIGGSLGKASGRIVLLCVALAAVGYFAGVGPVESRIDSILYKTDVLDTERDLFSSRRGPWEMAAERASQSGFLGAGFGIFPGEALDGMSWLTTVGYGFESGNGWYAVKMQLGYVGLCLYVLIGVSLLAAAARMFRSRGARDGGALAWTFLGIAIGLYAHSFFEAWIVSPGSPENALFWAVIGTFSGLRAGERRVSLSMVTRPGSVGRSEASTGLVSR